VTRPETSHESTAAVVAVCTCLVEHAGWIATSGVADRTGLGRDTCRRILAELATHGWAERAADDAGDRWTCGAALPRLGLTWMRVQAEQAEALRNRFQDALRPFNQETP